MTAVQHATVDENPRRATFLMTSSSAPGHFLRVLDLAQQLTSRGHRVLFKAKAAAAAEVEAAGAELVPYENLVDFQDFAAIMSQADMPAWIPNIVSFAMMQRVFQAMAVQLAKEIEPVLRRERVDCVVYDFFDFGAAWAAERAGIPWASAGNMGTVLTRDELPLFFDATPRARALGKAPGALHAVGKTLLSLDKSRAKLGLPPYEGRTADVVRAMSSPHLHIVMAHRGLAGNTPLRDKQVFCGPTTFNVHSPSHADAPRLEPGTVVVTTTTTGKDEGLFRRVLEAVATMNVPILATAASAKDIPTGLGAHVRIERYIPHDMVFPDARAVITHGGWGTVGRALLHGAPMLAIPLFGDQHLNAALVERAGLGRRLPLDKASPSAIRAELLALLADEPLRARAKSVAVEIKQIKAELIAARALEDLAFGAGAGSSVRSAA